MQNTKLKPCPFCSSSDLRSNSCDMGPGLQSSSVTCKKCGATVGRCDLEAEKYWNARGIDKALENAEYILANFKPEGERDKLDEWQGSYAMLFKQMNEIVAAKKELYYYDTHNWEFTTEDKSLIIDDMNCKEIVQMGVLQRLQDIFIAQRYIEAKDEYETEEFATLEAAEAWKNGL